MSTTRWASCSREVNPVVAEYRHIVRRGALTTACGATASTPDVWRGNRNKPKCPTCLKAAVVIGSPRPERTPPMTDTTPTEGTEHPGCTECGGTGTVYLPDVDGWHPEPCDAYATAEGTEGHEHLWQRRQSVTSKGDAMPAYEVCVIPGCDRARRADRPTPPVSAAEDDAVERVARALWARGIDPSVRACQRIARAALDAAGVPGLRAEVERLRDVAMEEAERADATHEALDAARQQVADLRAGIRALADEFKRYGYAPTADLRALAGSGEQPGEGCGHPNHGVDDHDCRPFRPAPVVPDEPTEDERITAWHEVVSHPFFKPCFKVDGPLLDAMLAHMDDILAVVGQGVTAERAWEQGYLAGIRDLTPNGPLGGPNPYRAVVRSGEQGGEGR